MIPVKEVYFDQVGRERIKRGVDTLANAVKVTLGAKGRNVIIDQTYNDPQITKDGVTVARSIVLEDRIENMGAQLIKTVAHKTNEEAGDGTTTASVLAQSIYEQGLKYITAGSDPMDLKRGIDKATKAVIDQLKKFPIQISESEELINKVAFISSNSDEQIASIITNAILSVPKNSVITIEEGGGEDSIEITEGMQFEKGYISPYFVTDSIKLEAVLDNPIILIYSGAINHIQPIMRSLEISNEVKRPLLIIADEMSPDVTNLLVLNKIKGTVQVCVSKAPAYGSNRKDIMEDIAALTGGKAMFPEKGMNIEEITVEDFGEAGKVIVTQNTTLIVGGKGNKSDIDHQLDKINYQIKNAVSAFDRERYEERLSKMSGGVGVIRVGGNSEVEIKERKDRFEDSLNATKAAIDEGVVPGGGIALLNCTKVKVKGRNIDENLGIRIILDSIQEPFNQILRNASVSYEVVKNKVLSKGKKFGYGYNVFNEKYENFFETGIIDPVKVTRIALENASSIAGLLLTTDCIVVDKETKKEDNG